MNFKYTNIKTSLLLMLALSANTLSVPAESNDSAPKHRISTILRRHPWILPCGGACMGYKLPQVIRPIERYLHNLMVGNAVKTSFSQGYTYYRALPKVASENSLNRIRLIHAQENKACEKLMAMRCGFIGGGIAQVLINNNKEHFYLRNNNELI